MILRLVFCKGHPDFNPTAVRKGHGNDCVRCLTQWMEKMMNNSYRTGSNQVISRISIIGIAAVLITGCASMPAPTEQMAVSRAAVSNAASAGGGEFAPQQLKSAMDKMDAAQRAMLAEDYVLARQLAEQAQVDAQLATAVARSAKARKAAEELQESSRVLRQEIDRKSK
jgi:Domain of unknown function (DUF4398)